MRGANNRNSWAEQRRIDRLLKNAPDTAIEQVAKALFKRDVEEDVCDGTWEENEALHERILADAKAAIDAYLAYCSSRTPALLPQQDETQPARNPCRFDTTQEKT